jgi:hypothetical protein
VSAARSPGTRPFAALTAWRQVAVAVFGQVQVLPRAVARWLGGIGRPAPPPG